MSSAPAASAPAHRPKRALPPCPITGRPAARVVQAVSTATLLGIWRGAGGGDLSRLCAGVDRLTLHESDAGLFFFDPMIAGDGAFYNRFYRNRSRQRFSGLTVERAELRHAASLVPAGARVLDVGCGPAAFRRYLGDAVYTGIDPYEPADPARGVLAETLEAHTARGLAPYDVVTAFQVIEHVVDSLAFARAMLAAVRPGGLLILCAPLHPSPLTAIPNFPISAPPHHLTWWTETAFASLAAELGCTPVDSRALPLSAHASTIAWMEKLSFAKSTPPPKERYFGHNWLWHANLAVSYALGEIAGRILPVPKSAAPIDLFLSARKPG